MVGICWSKNMSLFLDENQYDIPWLVLLFLNYTTSIPRNNKIGNNEILTITNKFYSPYKAKLMFLKSAKKVPITIFSLSLRVLVILRFDCSTLEITYTVEPQFNKITFMVYLGLKK